MERQNLETLSPEISNEEEEISKSSLAVMRTNKYIRMLALCASLYMPISCAGNSSIVRSASAAVAKTTPETDTDKREEMSDSFETTKEDLIEHMEDVLKLEEIKLEINQEYALNPSEYEIDNSNIQKLKRLLDPKIKDWIEKISNEYELTLKDYNDLYYLLDYYDSSMKEGLLSNDEYNDTYYELEYYDARMEIREIFDFDKNSELYQKLIKIYIDYLGRFKTVKNIFEKNKANGITYNAETLLYLFVEYKDPHYRYFLDILKNEYDIDFKDIQNGFDFIGLLDRADCLEDLDKKTTHSRYINFIEKFNFKKNKYSLETFLIRKKLPFVICESKDLINSYAVLRNLVCDKLSNQPVKNFLKKRLKKKRLKNKRLKNKIKQNSSFARK